MAIMGMHCAGCVAGVEDALRAVGGVRDASVNLATESASLGLDPQARPSLDALIRAVRAAGYEASLLDPIARSVEHRARQRSDELRKRRDRLLITTLLGLPVVLVHMLPDRLLPGELVQGRLALAAQAILTFLVLAIGAGDMLRAALQAALRRAGTMDLLVSLGAATAFVAGIFGVITGKHELILFESAVMIVLFVSLGKLLELRSRGRASAVLESLLLRVPRQALRVRGETVESVAVDDLSPSDIVRIVAPATIPVDGVVVRGALAVDQSMLTGESEPVDREASDEVLGGCTAVSGSADIRATTTGATCAAARMARLVEAAQAGKPPIQRIADRAAGVFVPVVLLLAFLTTVGWTLAGSPLIDSLTRGIAVLVIACPCAMGLAVPTAVLVGTAAAGARGILVRNVESLEAAAKASRVLLDKTGTLTAGRPTVVGVTAAPSWDERRPKPAASHSATPTSARTPPAPASRVASAAGESC
ncbi:MAG: cation-translocating P-type ATPase [Planctomycetes bacterium]|nr:cation-translocating P-type ATPase [Planctomycetota bacterium]